MICLKPLAGLFTVLVAACAACLPARAAPVLDYGVGAFVFVDAGSAHWFANAGGAGVATTGVLTQGVSDTARGGTQIASTSAYANLGSLGGKVLASTSGALLETAQGSNDLSWYADLLVTGPPGTRVAFTFATSLDGFVAGAGSNYSSRVHSTTFVAGVALADWTFIGDVGLIDEFVSASYEFDVGSVIRLGSRLGVSAHADIEAGVSANAFDTAKFYVDVLTPGGGYVAGGGVVFAQLPGAAAPESSTAGLLAVALVLLGWSRRGPWWQAVRRAAVLVGAAFAVPAALSAPTFSYVTLDVPGAAQTQAYGIDDAGRVVGAYLDAAGTWRGFVYAAGAYTTIAAPGAAYTDAFGISNRGAIVGTASPVAQPGNLDFTQGYLLAGGSFTPITVAGAVQTGAFGVNDSNTVVGSYRSDPPAGGGLGYHGFAWSAGVATTIDIANAGGGIDDTSALGINNAGQIVGQYGLFCAGCAASSFRWDAGLVTTFAPFAALASGAFDINDFGDIVGWFGPGEIESGYLYADGEFSLIAPPAASYAEAVGINNQRWVVGAWSDAAGAIHGFLATPLVVPEPLLPWLLVAGAVAGFAVRRWRLDLKPKALPGRCFTRSWRPTRSTHPAPAWRVRRSGG